METREIAMSKLTKLMGATSVLALAALTASPASAGALMAPALSAATGYARLDDAGFGANGVFLGGTVGGPLGLAGLGVQADAAITEAWASNWSAINWVGGGDIFWGGDEGRFGLDVHGDSYHENAFNVKDANVGAFGEWYLNNITVAGKGGWFYPSHGHGNYLGAAGIFYPMPSLALAGSFDWFDAVMHNAAYSPYRYDQRDDIFSVWAEWMVVDTLPLTVGAFFSYDDYNYTSGSSGPGHGDHATLWGLRVKYYLGGNGSLEDMHRNGLLFDWDKGTDWYDEVPF
jgi:hypothetical protein